MKKIGVFAKSSSQQARNVYESLNALHKVHCNFFNIELTGEDAVSISESGVFWNGMNIADLDAAYTHGYAYENPVVPDNDDNQDWSVWQSGYLVNQQRYSFLFSLFNELHRRGVTLLNSPRVLLQHFMKPFWLEKLRSLNFSVPRFICSNHMPSVITFCGQTRTSVWRPATGRASWQLFQDKQRMALIRPDSPPVLVAESISGPYIRAYVYNGVPLCFLAFSAPDIGPPERLESVWETECPGVSSDLQRLARETGLRWAMVAFVWNDEKPWIYDIDPDPILDWLPDIYREYLTAKLSHMLAGETDRANSLATPNQVAERPILFLRRMLRILFEFEKVKYPS